MVKQRKLIAVFFTIKMKTLGIWFVVDHNRVVEVTVRDIHHTKQVNKIMAY